MTKARSFRPILEPLEDRVVPATFVVGNLDDAGSGSLRQAILSAEATSGPDEISFAVGGTITLTSGPLDITESVHIIDSADLGVAISGNNSSRIFNVTSGTLQLTDVTLTAGQDTSGGAVLLTSAGSLEATDCAFTNNHANAGVGGAISITGSGSVTVTECTFDGNTALVNGGAIDSIHPTVNITNSTFDNNSANNGGAAVSIGGSATHQIVGSQFINNQAGGRGGALQSNSQAIINITNSVFSNNEASSGGAISQIDVLPSFGGGDLTISGSTFANNTALGPEDGTLGLGGAIFNGSTLTISGSIFTDNIAQGAQVQGDGLGGAIYNQNGSVASPFTVTITDSAIDSNQALGGNGRSGGGVDAGNGRGGGIYNGINSLLVITGTTLSANQAVGGDGVNEGTLFGESGDGQGGGIYNVFELDLSNSTLSSNLAVGGRGVTSGGNLPLAEGGGLGNYGAGLARVTSAMIVNNQAPQTSNFEVTSGGGVYNDSSAEVTLRNSIVANNTSETANGFGGFGPDVFGTITSSGFNLIGDTTDSSGFGASGDILNQDPQLGSLTNNGGSTVTHAPLPGSIVLGAGDSSLAGTTDQTGRVRNASVDIGAVDIQVDAVTLAIDAEVSTGADEVMLVRVRALDASGNPALDYTGTIAFFTSDPLGVTPGEFTFALSDQGTQSFQVQLSTAGLQSLTITDTVDPSLTDTVDILVTPGAVSFLEVSPLPSVVQALQPQSLTVTARDFFGNVATGYTGTVTFSSSDPLASLPADFTFTAGDQGVANFSVSFSTLGSQSLLVEDLASSEVAGSTSTRVEPGDAVSLEFTPLPRSVMAGVPNSILVTALDALGNIATAYTGTVTFASSDPQAFLPSNFTFSTDDQGMALFSVTLATAGNQSLSVTDLGNPTLTATTTTTVTPGDTAALEIAPLPASVIAGVPQSVTVTALDEFGNITPTYTGTVTFTSTDALAGLPADFTFTSDNQGVAQFLVSFGTAGFQTLQVEDTLDVEFVTDTSTTVEPAQAMVLDITPLPTSVVAGETRNVTVTALDAFNNVATGYTGTVTFSSSDPLSSLPADFTFTPGNQGVATFSVALGTAGTQTLILTDTAAGGLTDSTTTQVVAGQVASLQVDAPQNVLQGTEFEVTVTALDTFNNLVPTYTGTVQVTSSALQAVLPEDFTFTLADGGTRAFTLTLLSVGSQTLNVQDTADTSIVGMAQLTVENVAPANLTLEVEPTTLPEGDGVTLEGSFTNMATFESHTVSIDWGDGSLPTVLSLPAGVLSFEAEHTYPDDQTGVFGTGVKNIVVTVLDANNGSVQASTSVEILNVAPDIDDIDDRIMFVGEELIQVVSFEDPGADTHLVTIQFGAFPPSQITLVGEREFTIQRPLTDEGTFPVTVTVMDDDGGTATTTFLVHVLLPGIPPGEVDIKKAGAGETVTASVPGVRGTLFRSTTSEGEAGILVAVVPQPVVALLPNQNPISTLNVDSSYDVRAFGVSQGDMAVVTFSYKGDGIPVLEFFNPVTNSFQPFGGNMTVDTEARTITIVLDDSSMPRLADTRRTVFTITLPQNAPLPTLPPPGRAFTVPASPTIPVPLFALQSTQDRASLVAALTGVTTLALADTGSQDTSDSLNITFDTGIVGGGGPGEASEEESPEGGESENPLPELPPAEAQLIVPQTATVSPSQPDATLPEEEELQKSNEEGKPREEETLRPTPEQDTATREENTAAEANSPEGLPLSADQNLSELAEMILQLRQEQKETESSNEVVENNHPFDPLFTHLPPAPPECWNTPQESSHTDGVGAALLGMVGGAWVASQHHTRGAQRPRKSQPPHVRGKSHEE